MNLDELLNKLEEEVKGWDVSVESLIRHGKNHFNRDPSCFTCTNPGCCYQLTFVSMLETLPLARLLMKQKRATPGFVAHLWKVGKEMEGLGNAGWFKKARPCVFLENNRCTIYELRPLACRHYYVWSPAEYCLPESEEGSKPDSILLTGSDQMTTFAIERNLYLARVLGLPVGLSYMATLPRMLAILLTALEMPNWRKAKKFIARQPYPSLHNYSGWLKGNNPFARKEGSHEEVSGQGQLRIQPRSGG